MIKLRRLLNLENFEHTKHIYIFDEYYGQFGESVPKHLHKSKLKLKVGDLVSFDAYDEKRTGIILRDNHKYGIFGWGCHTLDFKNLKLVTPFYKLSNVDIENNIDTQNKNIEIITKRIDN